MILLSPWRFGARLAKNILTPIVILSFALGSKQLIAQEANTRMGAVRSVYQSPFHSSQQNAARTNDFQSLNLYGNPLLQSKNAFKNLFQTQNFRRHLSFERQAVHTIPGASSNAVYLNSSGAPHSQIESYQVKYKDVPVCGNQIKQLDMGAKGKYIIAKISEIDADIIDAQKIKTDDILLHINNFKSNKKFKSAEIIDWQNCLHIEKNQAYEIADLVVRFDRRLSYKMTISNTQVLNAFPLAFHVVDHNHTAAALADTEITAVVYATNKVTSELKEFTVNITTGEGTLTNDYFETDTGDLISRYEVTSNHIELDENDLNFAEVSSFVHANAMLDYYQDIGFTWTGPAALIQLHELIGGTKNNALYQPGISFSDNRPRISIGDGDGKILANLPTDSDVVSHELGHHIIFEHLKEIQGESLILHEGLADFFAFDSTSDTCLGESICPAGSRACIVENQCLRQASPTMQYADSTYVSYESHLKGQLISGLLWDLRDIVGEQNIGRFVLTSISFLLQNSGFRDFALSLLYADATLNDGDNACDIVELLEDRNFDSFITDVECQQSNTVEEIPKLDGSKSSSTVDSPPAPTQRTTSSKKKSGLCGSTASASGEQNKYGWMILLLILFPPILSVSVGKRVPARVKRRTKR